MSNVNPARQCEECRAPIQRMEAHPMSDGGYVLVRCAEGHELRYAWSERGGEIAREWSEYGRTCKTCGVTFDDVHALHAHQDREGHDGYGWPEPT